MVGKGTRNTGLIGGLTRFLGARSPTRVLKSNRAAAVDIDRFKETAGTGEGWAKTAYGEYYATSVPIYSAVKLRADALAKPPVRVVRRDAGSAGWVPVAEGHPAQELVNGVNRWYTRGELWRATEIYLCLWGSVFWALERDATRGWEIWPLRPDRVRILPDKRNYIRGYVYTGLNGPVAYTAEEVVWIHYFNPLEEYAGMSPIAPVRLPVDMGLDAQKFNRNFFRNSAQPDVIFTTEESMSDAEVEDFYQRWEKRYKGPGNAHRPAIASFIKDIKTVNVTQREMEFHLGLRWSLEEVSRVYGVPMPLLQDYQQATFANIQTAERLFWRNTMVPEMRFLEEKLLPKVGYPELRVEFDLSSVEALREDEDSRVIREVQLLDRGVLTINEVRRGRNLPTVPWGEVPIAVPDAEAPGSRARSVPGDTLAGPWVQEDARNGHEAGPVIR